LIKQRNIFKGELNSATSKFFDAECQSGKLNFSKQDGQPPKPNKYAFPKNIKENDYVMIQSGVFKYFQELMCNTVTTYGNMAFFLELYQQQQLLAQHTLNRLLNNAQLQVWTK
jgi:hypothetical protein